MCIIIVVPETVKLPTEEIFETCWDNNPHYGGFMYVSNGRIKIRKYDKKQEYIDACIKYHAKYGKESPFVFHMRYNTQGGVTLANTHPFKINRNAAFAHNGVISQCGHSTAKTNVEKALSDTRLFKRRILKKLPLNLLVNDLTQHLIAEYVGSSKLVFLFNNKEYSIVNEKRGEWIDGVWFSNDYYKSTRKSSYTWVNHCSSFLKYPVYISTPNNTNQAISYTSGVCRICESALEKEPPYPLMVKISVDNISHTHYTTVCHECLKAIIEVHELPAPEKPTTCDLCACVLDKKKTVWRNEVYCIDFTTTVPYYLVLCSSCANTEWKLEPNNAQCSYSSMDAAWLIDPHDRLLKYKEASDIINSARKANIQWKENDDKNLYNFEDEIYYGM